MQWMLYSLYDIIRVTHNVASVDSSWTTRITSSFVLHSALRRRHHVVFVWQQAPKTENKYQVQGTLSPSQRWSMRWVPWSYSPWWHDIIIVCKRHTLLASTQEVKPCPFTCQLQWMWHSRNCSGCHIHAFNTSLFIHDELRMQSSTNFFWQQKHSLSFFIHRIPSDPFLAYYGTTPNNALTGSRVNITLSPVTTEVEGNRLIT